MAPRDLGGSNLQCLLIDSEADLVPDTPFGTFVLAWVPLTLTLDLDPCAINQKVYRALGATIRDVHGQHLLAAR